MQENHFFKAFLGALFLILTFTVFWEYYWRHLGFPISYNDDKMAWATERQKIYGPPGKTTVFIGDSRVKFDIRLDTWKSVTGEECGAARAGGNLTPPHIARPGPG